MNLKQYIQPIEKWWWMLVVAGFVAGISSFIISLQQPPIFQAHTTLMIGQTINDPNPAQNQFYLEQQLAGIYANTAMRQPIRDATMKALDLTWLPEYNVVAAQNSQLIEIWVNDSNPVRAQAVAVELARQLILRSPTTNQNDDQTRQAFIQSQLNNLQSQIKTTQEEVEKLKAELGNLNSARQISEKQSEIGILESKLSMLQSNFANLLGNSESGAPNSLTVVEPAELPTVPIGPNRALIVLLSSLIGVSLATAGAYAIEFLDPTFRSSQDVKRALQIPILGEIVKMPKDNDAIYYVVQNSLSPTADSFRMIKNSLEVVDLGNSLRYIQMISSEAFDGKTTMSMNLAATIARSGRKVLLVDADLRKASLSTRLNLQNNRGLSNVFLGEGELSSVITPSTVDNLVILPAGNKLTDTSGWFTSSRMQLIINDLGKLADIVIFDSTPAVVPDSMELARLIMNLIFVVRINHSRRDIVTHFKEQFDLVGVKILGAILNDVPMKQTFYGGYYNRYGYYGRSETGSPSENQQSKKNHGTISSMGDLIKEKIRSPRKENN